MHTNNSLSSSTNKLLSSSTLITIAGVVHSVDIQQGGGKGTYPGVSCRGEKAQWHGESHFERVRTASQFRFRVPELVTETGTRIRAQTLEVCWLQSSHNAESVVSPPNHPRMYCSLSTSYMLSSYSHYDWDDTLDLHPVGFPSPPRRTRLDAT